MLDSVIDYWSLLTGAQWRKLTKEWILTSYEQPACSWPPSRWTSCWPVQCVAPVSQSMAWITAVWRIPVVPKYGLDHSSLTYSRWPKVWLGSQQFDVFPLSQSVAWITAVGRIPVGPKYGLNHSSLMYSRCPKVWPGPQNCCVFLLSSRYGRVAREGSVHSVVVVLAASLTLGLLVSSEWISQGGTGPGVVWAQEHTGPGVVWPGEGLVHSAAQPDTGGVQTLRPGPRLASWPTVTGGCRGLDSGLDCRGQSMAESRWSATPLRAARCGGVQARWQVTGSVSRESGEPDGGGKRSVNALRSVILKNNTICAER